MTGRLEIGRGQTIRLNLLTPTRIRIESLLKLLDVVLGERHAWLILPQTVSGKMFPRMLPDLLTAELRRVFVAVSVSVLKWLKQAGYVNNHEFARGFNAGMGMNGLGGRFFTGGWSQCSALAM